MLLNLVAVSKSYGERLLFSDASLSVERGMKIGLIGANGAGKTTLFRMIVGKEQADVGQVVVGSGVKIGYLEQHTCADSSRTTYTEALQIFRELQETERTLNALTEMLSVKNDAATLEQYNKTLEAFQNAGGLTYASRTRATLKGLGFTDAELELPVQMLSGGQKAKIGLAKLLLSEPDIMLLDEPTNHLDLPSVIWLEEFLQQSKCACLLISHDRYFLDRITTHTAEIYAKKLYFTKGNYSRYQELKEERLLSEQRHYDNVMAEVHRLENIIRQQRKWNRERNIRMAESKEKQIARLTDNLYKPESENNAISFRFVAPAPCGEEVLKAEGLSMAFEDKSLYRGVDLEIRKGEKVFLVGANGCGKTTLLRTLLHPEQAPVLYGVGVKVGYFEQHQQNLTLENTAFSELRNAFPHIGDTVLRNTLAVFGFRGDEVFEKIADLSGGERARISLCKLVLTGANLLILDEPTNHLDIYSVSALETALALFEGTVLAVSHDRYFINALADRVLELAPEGLTEYTNSADYFAKASVTPVEQKAEKTVGAGKEVYLRRKEERAQLRRMQNRKRTLEKEIAELENKTAEWNRRLREEVDVADYEEITRITTDIAVLENRYEELLEAWEENENELLQFDGE
ncbi:MAG: ABC-F family ATP-binding cassette domain-containing protein [Clostridia bacterium]|nr:ABC-F family ATP-binding cassette domain-containing protein [Clostridia bacterium]